MKQNKLERKVYKGRIIKLKEEIQTFFTESDLVPKHSLREITAQRKQYKRTLQGRENTKC